MVLGPPWGFESLDAATSARAPLSPEHLHYRGHYQHGDEVVLAYTVVGRSVLERPAAHDLGGNVVLSHTLQIGPGTRARKIYVGRLAEAPRLAEAAGHVAVVEGADGFVAAAVTGETDGLRL